MQVGYFLAEIGGMYKKFQSLIHQGKNASSKMGIVLRFVGGVSIPYSSGEKCKDNGIDWRIYDYDVVSIPYSSGEKCKALSEGKRPETLNYVFQSLIHQGKNAREVNCSCGAALKGSFNPLFIRGKMQAERESAAEHNVIVCKGFNPLFIRGKMQVSKMRGGDGRSGAMVSIPYSSGEKCKNEINGPGERK